MSFFTAILILSISPVIADTDSEETDLLTSPLRPEFQRCTRRYTPGACLEPMHVVWTFHFQIQNCTERLGCPSVSRTNRFQKYSICMQRCRPVAELYAQILAVGRNETDLMMLRSKAWGRRLGDEQSDSEEDPPEPDYDYQDSGDQTVGNPNIAQEQDPVLDLLPADVDRVERILMTNSDDPFHGLGHY